MAWRYRGVDAFDARSRIPGTPKTLYFRGHQVPNDAAHEGVCPPFFARVCGLRVRDLVAHSTTGHLINKGDNKTTVAGQAPPAPHKVRPWLEATPRARRPCTRSTGTPPCTAGRFPLRSTRVPRILRRRRRSRGARHHRGRWHTSDGALPRGIRRPAVRAGRHTNKSKSGESLSRGWVGKYGAREAIPAVKGGDSPSRCERSSPDVAPPLQVLSLLPPPLSPMVLVAPPVPRPTVKYDASSHRDGNGVALIVIMLFAVKQCHVGFKVVESRRRSRRFRLGVFLGYRLIKTR